ncbi:hypothetical protein HDU67_002344 [Dinochytrium kinnereticum]|nr:hypothetical protein HDU67_002344 [Dinochytrium kinnereticum]
MFSSPTGGSHSVDIGYLRLQSRHRLKTAWESLFERYGRSFDDETDEIDIETGKVVVDRGFFRGTPSRRFGMLAEDSVGPPTMMGGGGGAGMEQQPSSGASEVSSVTSAAVDWSTPAIPMPSHSRRRLAVDEIGGWLAQPMSRLQQEIEIERMSTTTKKRKKGAVSFAETADGETDGFIPQRVRAVGSLPNTPSKRSKTLHQSAEKLERSRPSSSSSSSLAPRSNVDDGEDVDDFDRPWSSTPASSLPSLTPRCPKRVMGLEVDDDQDDLQLLSFTPGSSFGVPTKKSVRKEGSNGPSSSATRADKLAGALTDNKGPPATTPCSETDAEASRRVESHPPPTTSSLLRAESINPGTPSPEPSAPTLHHPTTSNPTNPIPSVPDASTPSTTPKLLQKEPPTPSLPMNLTSVSTIITTSAPLQSSPIASYLAELLSSPRTPCKAVPLRGPPVTERKVRKTFRSEMEDARRDPLRRSLFRGVGRVGKLSGGGSGRVLTGHPSLMVFPFSVRPFGEVSLLDVL